MALIKHALIRYRALDGCFRNHKAKYNIKGLIEAVNRALEEYDPSTNGVGRSTVYEDIEFMESSDGWDIELERYKEGRTVYMRYVDADFSINNMPLNATEANTLKEAIELLSQFKGMPQFQWIEEMIPKLQQGIKPEIENAIMSFDANQYLKGIEWLGQLHNSILYKKSLEIEYKDFKSSEPYTLQIHPYYLKQFNNRWFLFGLNHITGRIWNLALDRVESIKDSKLRYTPNNTIDWNEYFDDIIGVTKPENGKVEKIELLFNEQRAQYVLTKPLHGSQKTKQTKDGLQVTLELIINKELVSTILYYGKDVTVLNPEGLKTEILTNYRSALNNYQ